jgi:hypothetical protein
LANLAKRGGTIRRPGRLEHIPTRGSGVSRHFALHAAVLRSDLKLVKALEVGEL